MTKEGPAGQTALIVSHNYWPTPGAGQLRMGMLTRALRRLGYSVAVISMADTESSSTLKGPAGETILQVGSRPGPRFINLCRYAIRSLLQVATRPSLVVTDPPPVVAAPVLLCARILGLHSAYYLSDSWEAVAAASPKPWLRLLAPLFRGLDSVALRAASRVVAVTESLTARAEASAPGKVAFKPNGIDLSAYSSGGPSWTPPSDFPKRFLVYAGNSGQVHGAHVFIEAADTLQGTFGPFGLVYITYGSHAHEVKAHAKSASTPVLFLERMPAEQVASVIRGSVAALSSIRNVPGYRDARPIKALAGIACGVPVVYVGSGAFADVIDNEGLGFVADYSIEGATQALRGALMLDPELRRMMSARSSTFAAKHLDQRLIAEGIVNDLDAGTWGRSTNGRFVDRGRI